MTTSRRMYLAGRPPGLGFGTYGAISRHWAFVRSVGYRVLFIPVGYRPGLIGQALRASTLIIQKGTRTFFRNDCDKMRNYWLRHRERQESNERNYQILVKTRETLLDVLTLENTPEENRKHTQKTLDGIEQLLELIRTSQVTSAWSTPR